MSGGYRRARRLVIAGLPALRRWPCLVAVPNPPELVPALSRAVAGPSWSMPGSECPLEDGLDVLVNNAGAGVTARLARTSLAGDGQVMSVNVISSSSARGASSPRLARGSSCMISIASDAGYIKSRRPSLYSVTKAGVAVLGTMLALDDGPDGVPSHVLCPRATSSPA